MPLLIGRRMFEAEQHRPQNKTAKKPQAKRPRVAGEEDTLPSLASATASKLKSRRKPLGAGTSSDPLSLEDDDGADQNAVAGPSSSPTKRGMTYVPEIQLASLIHLDPSPAQDLLPLIPVTIDRVKYHAAVRDPKVSCLYPHHGKPEADCAVLAALSKLST